MRPIQRVQVVWAHPRVDSLTAELTREVISTLRSHGLDVDELDLIRSGFNPHLDVADEPDWIDLDRAYSPEVHEHAERTQSADAVIFVFPVWWYSVPAVMKGYIDRVWNYGLFYGEDRGAGVRAVRWIGLAGESLQAFQKRSYDELMAHHLNIGIAGLCKIKDSRVHLLYDTLADDIDQRIPDYTREVHRIVSELVTAAELEAARS